MKGIQEYQSSLMTVFIMFVSMSLLACGSGRGHGVLGMQADYPDEEVDLERMPAELRETASRSVEKAKHYRQKATEATKELEKETREVEIQKQKNDVEIAQLRTQLTFNMLQLGVSLNEINEALGSSTNDQEQDHFSQRELLLREIREKGPTLLKEIGEQRLTQGHE